MTLKHSDIFLMISFCTKQSVKTFGCLPLSSIERHQYLEHALSVDFSKLRKHSIRNKEFRSHIRAQLNAQLKPNMVDYDMYKS